MPLRHQEGPQGHLISGSLVRCRCSRILTREIFRHPSFEGQPGVLWTGRGNDWKAEYPAAWQRSAGPSLPLCCWRVLLAPPGPMRWPICGPIRSSSKPDRSALAGAASGGTWAIRAGVWAGDAAGLVRTGHGRQLPAIVFYRRHHHSCASAALPGPTLSGGCTGARSGGALNGQGGQPNANQDGTGGTGNLTGIPLNNTIGHSRSRDV